MASLTVWKFEEAGGAATARDQLVSLQKQELIKVLDAAVVSWPEGAKKPKTKQAFSTTGAGAASGAFWGMLFGLIFFIPLFGLAFGAAMGALGGSMSDFGIDDDFINSVRDQVTEGTSALFLMSSDAVVDKIKEQVDLGHAELISTNLSVDDEEALRAAFEE